MSHPQVIFDFHTTEVMQYLNYIVPSFVHMIRVAVDENQQDILNFMIFEFIKVVKKANQSLSSANVKDIMGLVLEFCEWMWNAVDPTAVRLDPP